jgi:biopolymer transport protein TolR
MARTFKRQRTAQAISELNVTNLIDVAFTLLIIFMIATPLINQEQTLPVNLPIESVREQPAADPRDRFETLTIRADGKVELGGREMTLEALSPILAGFAAEAKPPVIRLRMDAKATAQHYVSVMAELERQKISRLSIDYQIIP